MLIGGASCSRDTVLFETFESELMKYPFWIKIKTFFSRQLKIWINNSFLGVAPSVIKSKIILLLLFLARLTTLIINCQALIFYRHIFLVGSVKWGFYVQLFVFTFFKTLSRKRDLKDWLILLLWSSWSISSRVAVVFQRQMITFLTLLKHLVHFFFLTLLASVQFEPLSKKTWPWTYCSIFRFLKKADC